MAKSCDSGFLTLTNLRILINNFNNFNYLRAEDVHVLGVELKGRPPLDPALEVHRDVAALGGASRRSTGLDAVEALLFTCELDLFLNL